MRSAQKLAQDGNAALEIYQRQMRKREEQLAAAHRGHSGSARGANLRAVKVVSERERAQWLDLLEDINLVQTGNETLRRQLSTLERP